MKDKKNIKDKPYKNTVSYLRWDEESAAESVGRFWGSW